MARNEASPESEPPRGKVISQGHPTNSEPDANKGGQVGGKKPDGGAERARQGGGADAGATADDPGRGGD